MRKLSRIFISAAALSLLIGFGIPALVLADTPPAGGAQANAPKADPNCPPGTPVGTVCLRNPLGTTQVPQLVGRIINAALGTVGAIAFLMFVYGGFLWLTSAGSADRVKLGKDVMKWASIGLIIIFSSYGLVQLVFRSVGAL